MSTSTSDDGLSPPTRGSPGPSRYISCTFRSIPAHAGKPSTADATRCCPRVYPRPRGEASEQRRLQEEVDGLSPPTRGSHRRQRPANELDGSIPAHAGKPFGEAARLSSVQVYPRPRGEADVGDPVLFFNKGLSPPTRGSRQDVARLVRVDGSIPAHAGKPWPPAARGSGAGVYPRPRGEASFRNGTRLTASGLSPPTRGSRPGATCARTFARSIPAHAGKPQQCAERSAGYRVYPRPRGEATQYTLYAVAARGLSPPTRGSPSDRELVHGGQRSIPAHAGKPLAYEVVQSLAGGQYGMFLTGPRSEWQVVAFFRRHRAPREKHAVAIPDLLGRISQTIQPQPSGGC